MSLLTLVAALAPFLTDADLDTKVATALINLAIGLSIGSLISGAAKSALRLRRQGASKPFAVDEVSASELRPERSPTVPGMGVRNQSVSDTVARGVGRAAPRREVREACLLGSREGGLGQAPAGPLRRRTKRPCLGYPLARPG